MGTAYLSNEVVVGAKQFFKTNQETKELISEQEIQERKSKITERAIRANDTCSFMLNNGVEIYLYDIINENITTINELCVSSSSNDSDIQSTSEDGMNYLREKALIVAKKYETRLYNYLCDDAGVMFPEFTQAITDSEEVKP